MNDRRNESAFTLLELLVGLIILGIGILGFSGMSVMMAKGNRQAQQLDEAATLVQSVIEDLSGVVWSDLGTDTTLPASNGLTGGTIRNEGPLNRNGEEIGTGSGPYLYYRYVVICTDADTDASTGSDYCAGSLNDSNRPPNLACSGLGLSSREKMIRVAVAWLDRTGKCHFKTTDSLAFQ